MDINCPECGKRLRAPDHLPNPLMRCRTCGATFRKSDLSSTEAAKQPAPPLQPAKDSDPRPAKDSDLDDFLVAQSSRPSQPPTDRSKAVAGGGLGGVILFVILMVLPQLPRIINALKDDDPEPPRGRWPR